MLLRARTDSYDVRTSQIYAGSAAIVEMSHAALVNEITLTFSGDVAVSEIQLLAKVGWEENNIRRRSVRGGAPLI